MLLAVLGYLQYSLWYGKNNVFDYQQTMAQLQNVQDENMQLRTRNEQMFAEIADLYDGSESIEERARSHLGMIKPNEHFYRIIGSHDNSKRGQ